MNITSVGNRVIAEVEVERYSPKRFDTLRSIMTEYREKISSYEELIIKLDNSYKYFKNPASNYYSMLYAICSIFENDMWGEATSDELEFKKAVHDGFVKSLTSTL